MEGYYKVLELDKFGGKLKLKEKSFRNLHRFEVLVRMVCTTIHPADLMFMKGEYGDIKPDVFPLVPGFEGSGEIIKVGEDIDKKCVGKRVSIFADSGHLGSFEGTWGEYHYTTLTNIIIYEKEVPYERICFIINPLSAACMLDTCKKENVAGVLQSGASSAVGKMFIRLCQLNDIQTVNLVRSDSGAKILRDMNAPNIIQTSEKDWEFECQKLCVQSKVQICFDCVGGEMTGKLFNLLPNGGTLYHYGNLEEKEMTKFNSKDLIFKDKTLKGWWLERWTQSLSQDELSYLMNYVKEEIQSDSSLFHSDVSKEFKLDEIQKAMDFYTSKSNHGKIILKTIST
jgi:NADPH2:quinone reductase